MAVNGENLVPLGRAGTGAALILNNDYKPLNTLIQGDQMRARAAAAEAARKAKLAQELARQWAEDRKLNLDTGGIFQEPFNKYAANAQDVIGGNYKKEALGQLDTFGRTQANATYRNEIERERLLGIDKDKTLAAYETAQAANRFRDTQGLHAAIGKSVLNPDGTRVMASKFDERGSLDAYEKDASTYAVDPIIGDYFKGLQASTIDEANAGRIGGIHSSSSLTYKGLIPVKRADGTWDVKRDAIGRPVISTTADELAQARASNHPLNMAVTRLEQEYAARQAQDPSLPARTGLDLYQEAARKYVSFRQADSEGRNAQPRAAAKPKAPPVFAQPVEGDYNIGGTFPVAGQEAGAANLPFGTPAGSITTLQGAQVPRPNQAGAYSGYSVAAPQRVTTAGEPKRFNLGPTGVQFTRVYGEGEDGTYSLQPNNNKPIVGELGDAVALPTRPDGSPVPPKNREEYRKALADPNARVQSFTQVITPKNKNYSAEYTQRLTQMKAERARQQDGDILGKGKYSTDAELEDKAREDATGETTIKYVPNEGQDARTVDRLSNDLGGKNAGSYRAHRQGLAGHVARVRGEGAAPARKVVDWGKTVKPGVTTNGTKTTGGKKVISW